MHSESESSLIKLKFGRASASIPVTTQPETIERLAAIIDEYNPENDALSASVGSEGLKIGIGKRINPGKVLGIFAGGIGLWYGGKFLSHCATKWFDGWMESRKKVKAGNQEGVLKTPVEAMNRTPTVGNWLERFRLINIRPEFPNVVENILGGVPNGMTEASILHILNAISTYCFSRVRAKFVDSNTKLHSPNLQVIVYGPSGSGKDKLRLLIEHYFARIIQRDKEKMAEKSNRVEGIPYPRQIVQTIGVGVSTPRLFETLRENAGIHCFLFDSEIRSLVEGIKSGSSAFSHEFFRKAYDGTQEYLDKKVKSAHKGYYDTAINYTLTGVLEDVRDFLPPKSIAGGDGNRIAFCTIRGGMLDSLFTLEGEDLDKIQDQLDRWQSSYAYYEKDGEDVPCDEYVINLDYVCTAITEWETTQINLRNIPEDDNRIGAIFRAGCTAFHFSMSLHMMWGEPDSSDPETQSKVVDGVIFLANLIIEGYFNFVDKDYETNVLSPHNEHEQVLEIPTDIPKSPDMMTEEELKKEWSRTGDYQYALLLNTKFLDSNGQSRYGGGTLNKLYPVYSVRSIQDKLSKLRNASQI